MSNSSADPEWNVDEALIQIQQLAVNTLGRPLSSDAAARALNLIQTSMDLSLSIGHQSDHDEDTQMSIVDMVDKLTFEYLLRLMKVSKG